MEHKSYLNSLGFRTYDALPTKALLPKHHKPGTRPLVTAYRVTTSNLSKHLANALNAVLQAIQTKYPDMFFPIKSSRDITTLLTALNLSTKYKQDYIRSKDISGCYDNIDHDDLKWVIRNIIPRTYAFMKRRYIKTAQKTSQFTNERKAHTFSTHFFSESELIDLLCWKVDNTIIQYGPIALKQNIGIGQGDNHSPQLCNLYLCFYEIQLLEFLKHQYPQHFPLLALTRRNIDDTLFFSPLADQITYLTPTQIGIYPKIFFTLSSTDLFPFVQTNFLDFHIYHAPNPYSHLRNGNLQPLNIYSMSETHTRKLCEYLSLPIKVSLSRMRYNLAAIAVKQLPTKHGIWLSINYNKIEEFPPHLKPVQYLHFDSLHPLSIKRAIIPSRLYAILHSTLHNPRAFILSLIQLVSKLCWNSHYPPKLVHNQVKRFVNAHKHFYHLSKRNVLTILFSDYRELYSQALLRSS